MSDLENFFYPKSIAIIGASNTHGKVGNALMLNLKKFKDRVYPINLKEKEVLGIKSYKSVLDVKDEIDLAVIAIPEQVVYNTLEECGKKGIKHVIIITAGFSEVGNIGGQNKLIQISNKYKIRIMG